MPFVSQAQRAKFHADPALRKYIPEFEAATPPGPLPMRVTPKKKPARKIVVVKPHVRRGAKRKGRKMAGKSMKPGGGGRFAAMVASGKSPALAAYIGRKKYGKQGMAHMAAEGRKRALHRMKG